MCQNSLPSGVGRSLGAKISGEGVIPGEYFLVSTKLDTFCYPTCKLHRATCRRFDTIPAYDGQTDRQTDGTAIAIACNVSIAACCKNWKRLSVCATVLSEH